jgi:hypothetical protein
MAGERWLCVAAVAVLALGGGAARADIINGDFSEGPDGLDGWVKAVVNPPNDESLALVKVVGGRLHVVTSNTYDWDGGSGEWVLHESDTSAVVVIQFVPADGDGFWAPDGTTAIEFDAEISISGNPAGNTGAGVRFEVNYNDGKYASAPTGDGRLGDTAGTVRVEMPGLVPNGQVGIDFNLASLSMLNPTPAHIFGVDSFTITVDAYFDNFRFVPEPMSAGMLLVGAAGLVLRRRRRRA